MMESGQGKIVHMHLFMDLKRMFPEIKDADITDCILLHGQNRERCCQELGSKSSGQQKGYYPQWVHSRTGSRSSSTSGISPVSPLSTLTPSSTLVPVTTSLDSPSIAQYQMSYYPQFEEGKCFELPDVASYPATQSHEGHVVYSTASSTKVLTTASYYQPAYHENPQIRATYPILNKPSSYDEGIPKDEFGSNEPKRLSHSIYSVEECLNEDAVRTNVSLDDYSNLLTNRCPSSMHPVTSTTVSTSSPLLPSPNTSSYLEYSGTLSAILQEQLKCIQRLKAEFEKRAEEKLKLNDEVNCLRKELDMKERMQTLDVESSKRRIIGIQTENNRLQLACDELEREILESECPKTDNSRIPTELPYASTENIRTPHTMHRASSTPRLTSQSSGYSAIPLSPVRRVSTPQPQGQPLLFQTVENVPLPSPSRNQRRREFVATPIDVEDTSEWSCSKCTFRNNCYLNECEMCGFSHVPQGTAACQNWALV